MSQSPIWGTEALRPLDLSLIETAKDLVRSKKGKPTQANLRRAVSTTYYALFHCLARTAADLLVGATRASRSDAAWTQAYRALDHGFAKGKCSNGSVMGTFPTAIREFGEEFVAMQLKRHAADYAPDDTYYKSAVLRDLPCRPGGGQASGRAGKGRAWSGAVASAAKAATPSGRKASPKPVAIWKPPHGNGTRRSSG